MRGNLIGIVETQFIASYPISPTLAGNYPTLFKGEWYNLLKGELHELLKGEWLELLKGELQFAPTTAHSSLHRRSPLDLGKEV